VAELSGPAAPRSAPAEILFYDGGCGLCHRAVRFVLAADRDGERFRFAPLGGVTFRATVTPEEAASLPDSLVLRRADGVLLVRSAAVLHVLRRLGGPWRALGALLGALPVGLRDRAYDAVARRRKRWFRSPEASCPVLPPRLRARFDV
jgi:predicted DCC family thiol-disulfide oxidoreductase YuxK